MAKRIDKNIIEDICILAKLSLTEEEKKKAGEDMQEMLDYVEKLDNLDTDGTEPLCHLFAGESVFREDEEESRENPRDLLVGAPRVKEGQYQVPKTIG